MSEHELYLDLQEIDKLESITERPRLQKLLALEKGRIQDEIYALAKPAVTIQNEATKSPPKPKMPTVKITSYAWDQSDKFVKIYLSNLRGVHSLDSASINLSKDGSQESLTIDNLNGKNYVFVIPKLSNPVENIAFKVKSDMVLLTFTKTEKEKWECLTEKEKAKQASTKMPDMDKNGDPSESLMGMMKKMYDDGDDEMKRTIAKAWSESRNKKDIP
ncbi:calcyclin-binding protein-like [Clavelina lepadiformis]|uniref:calcyclin-binding protein-like n=1 Tax=Clavelina lepadiformis TaxID=159417 RepID=UPI0040420250